MWVALITHYSSMTTQIQNSNFKAIFAGLALYLGVGIAVLVWMTIIDFALIRLGLEFRFSKWIDNNGLLSISGLVVLYLGGCLAFWCGRVCGELAFEESNYPRVILSCLLVVLAILLHLIIVGLPVRAAVILVGIIAFSTCMKGGRKDG